MKKPETLRNDAPLRMGARSGGTRYPWTGRDARRERGHIGLLRNGLHCTKARNSRKGGGAHLDVLVGRLIPVVRWHSLASAPFEPHMPHL